MKQTSQLFGGRHTHQKKIQGNRSISSPANLEMGVQNKGGWGGGRAIRGGANNLSFLHVDLEGLVGHQGEANHQLEKQVLKQIAVYCKIPKYATGLMKEVRCSLV